MEEALKDKKGILSRKIGEAKKKGEPIDQLLVEMKEVSAALKALSSQKKEKAKPAETDSPVSAALPQLFRNRQYGLCDVSAVRRATSDDAKIWNDYVERTQGASIYHRWEFKKLIEETFRHNAYYYLALDSEQNVCGILGAIELNSPIFGHYFVSIPFFNYGSALANSSEIEIQLMAELVKDVKNAGGEHVELRSTFPNKNLLEKKKKVSMILELPRSVESLWSDIGTKVRAQVKKGQRHNLDIKFGRKEILDDYYRVFSQNMRDLGTPVYAKKFFYNLLDSDLANAMNIAVVYDGKRPVSAAFLIGYRDTLEIPWASTLREANDRNANMYMYWEILSFAIAREYSFFDFGRSSKDAGTYKFKKQWGAQPQQLYWHYWLAEGDDMPEINPDNPKYRLLISVWKKMPVWLANLIGPHVVKFLP